MYVCVCVAFPRGDWVSEKHGKHSDGVRWKRREGHAPAEAYVWGRTRLNEMTSAAVGEAR